MLHCIGAEYRTSWKFYHSVDETEIYATFTVIDTDDFKIEIVSNKDIYEAVKVFGLKIEGIIIEEQYYHKLRETRYRIRSYGKGIFDALKLDYKGDSILVEKDDFIAQIKTGERFFIDSASIWHNGYVYMIDIRHDSGRQNFYINEKTPINGWYLESSFCNSLLLKLFGIRNDAFVIRTHRSELIMRNGTFQVFGTYSVPCQEVGRKMTRNSFKRIIFQKSISGGS